jgi:hypothetical protein
VAAAVELGAGRTVYLMPMGRGLDQFIANRLTRMHVLQVVADPAKAEIIFTDQVGSTLEDRLKELNPPPPDPDVKKEKDAAKVAKEKAEKEDMSSAHNGPPSFLGETVNKADKAGSMGVYGRGRGTIFLVDVKSGQVLWSVFEKPKNSNPHELDHTAERVVKQLKEDITAKAKAK